MQSIPTFTSGARQPLKMTDFFQTNCNRNRNNCQILNSSTYTKNLNYNIFVMKLMLNKKGFPHTVCVFSFCTPLSVRFWKCFEFFKIYFIHQASTVGPIFPPCSSPPSTLLYLWQSFLLSLCPWVMHISSLATLFPILFVTCPCLFCTYQFVLLTPSPFPPFSPFPIPYGNPPNDLLFLFWWFA